MMPARHRECPACTNRSDNGGILSKRCGSVPCTLTWVQASHSSSLSTMSKQTSVGFRFGQRGRSIWVRKETVDRVGSGSFRVLLFPWLSPCYLPLMEDTPEGVRYWRGPEGPAPGWLGTPDLPAMAEPRRCSGARCGCFRHPHAPVEFRV